MIKNTMGINSAQSFPDYYPDLHNHPFQTKELVWHGLCWNYPKPPRKSANFRTNPRVNSNNAYACTIIIKPASGPLLHVKCFKSSNINLFYETKKRHSGDQLVRFHIVSIWSFFGGCFLLFSYYICFPGGGSTRAVSLRAERSMSRAFPSLELDTVVEERSDPEPEATVVEMMTPDKDSDS